MTTQLPTPPQARAVERVLFGGLLGTLGSSLVARFLLLAFELPEIILVALLAVGATSGAFAARYIRQSPESVVDSLRTWNTRLRQICLKVMLWMLVLAAIIGVVTVLTASYDTLGRVAGTVVATAVVAGLLWPMSVLADKEKSQSAGLLGMVGALVVYLIIVPLIWELDNYDEEMLFTSLIIGLTLPFGMLFLGLTSEAKTWIAARVGVVVYVTVLLLFLIAAWHPGNWRSSENWAVTAWWCAAYGALSFGSLCGLRELKVNWRWIGVIAAFFAWILVLIGVWGNSKPEEQLIIVITSVAVVCAHTAVAVLVPLTERQQWLRIGTAGAVVVAAVFVDLEVVFQPGRGISMLGRISGAATIVASCGSLALMIFARLNRAVNGSDSLTDVSEITKISLFCPRCNARQTLPLGRNPCDKCGLEIVMAIEERPSSIGGVEPKA